MTGPRERPRRRLTDQHRPPTTRNLIATALVSAALIAIGLLGGGYLIALTADRTETDVRTIARLTLENSELAAENRRRITEISKLAEKSQVTTAAVCALRADLRRRVDSALVILRKNPSGVFGLTRREILINVRNQRRTIDALRRVRCR